VWSGDSVKIGRYVLLAQNVHVTDTNVHQLSALERQGGGRAGRAFASAVAQRRSIPRRDRLSEVRAASPALGHARALSDTHADWWPGVQGAHGILEVAGSELLGRRD